MLNILSSILSAVCLVLAFPRTDFCLLAWIGLVPLLLALDHQKPSAAFGLSYLCGLLFFTGTLYWFIHVTLLGAVLLFLYLAVYFGIFGLSYSRFQKKGTVTKLFLLPSIWVALEFLRAHLFTGFDWASLGHSQYKNLLVIQMADITGVFGVSFIIMMVNVFFKEMVSAVMSSKAERRRLLQPAVIVLSLLTLVCGYGFWQLRSSQGTSRLSIAVIQADIAQDMKWYEPAWPSIMERYAALTQEAAKANPHLIIWPETSFPGMLWQDEEMLAQLKDLVKKTKIPLLFGSVVKEKEDYYNSAVLLSPGADIIGRYDKVHLVPFGEYIPLRSLFPFLSQIVPIGDFTSGREYTIFSFSPTSRFSVLICFEDTVARLSREFVRQGSQLLINMTNDAWFEDTKAPFMHLQSAVFRTVENRKSLVRAANTGVSCFLDAWGRIEGCVHDTYGKMTYTSGYITQEAALNSRLSFYTKFGDVFTFCCFGCILWGIVYNRQGSSS